MRTRMMRPLGALLVLLLVTVMPGQAGAFFPDTGAGSTPRAAAPAAVGDWPMYGHDVSRTNYNPDETTISAGNVAQLVQRWQVNVGNNGTATSASPSVANGVVYVASSAASPASNFFAFNAVSGSQVWAENIGYRSSCFNVGIGSAPAISGTMISVGEDNAQSNPAYHGISTINGSVVWTNTMSVGASGFPWESPLNYGNSTYIGIASRCDNPSVRGEVRRLDLTTGALQANAYFVNAGGAGGGIWNSPALSPDGSTLFVGTGEDYSCTDCSLTRSMVSLDATTLAVLQHHQEPSPNQDLDFGTTPVVFHDSQNRTLVGAGHKNGTFYTYDTTNINAGAIWTRGSSVSVGLMPAYDPSFGTGGTLFIVAGTITAVDPGTGTVRWGPLSIPSAHGNIAIANGLIFVNGGASGLQIRSETDGSLLRTITPANVGAANSGVAISNGFIYWLSGSYINAWSLPPVQGTPTPTNTPGAPTNTPTNTPTRTVTVQPTNTAPPATATPINTATRTATVTPVPPSSTPGGPSNTPTRTSTPVPPTVTPGGPGATATATVCPIQFSDVPPTDPFYPYIRCLACRNIISGYNTSPPCGPAGGGSCFLPSNPVTRGQVAKIVSNAAGFTDVILSTQQTFADVPPSNVFWLYIERLALPGRGYISGYTGDGTTVNPCTGLVEQVGQAYFRACNNVTRGQLAKIDTNAGGYSDVIPSTQQTFSDVPYTSAFWLYIERASLHGVISGYSTSPPCPGGVPCFLPSNSVTRGQTAKIVANTFYPNCQTPQR